MSSPHLPERDYCSVVIISGPGRLSRHALRVRYLHIHCVLLNHFVYLICDGEGTELIMCPDFYAAVLCGLHFGSQWHLRRMTLLAVQARL